MRILYVCADGGVPLDGTKGASVHVRSMAEALRKAGHDVRLIVANQGSAEVSVGSVPVHSLQQGSLALEAVRRGVPDMIYERYSLGHQEGLRVARDLGSPFVLEVNAPLFREASRYRGATVGASDEDVERQLFRSADLVVTVSESLRRYVAQIRGTDRGTLVVRNGCDPAAFPVPAPLNGAPPQRLIFLGHPKPWHGAESLPGVIADLRRRGRDVALSVIGGGEGADRVIEQAKQLGVEDHVLVTGAVLPDEAARLLLDGTVAVAPYPPDPFFYFCPLKVIECMAAGLPVVTTAQGDLPALVDDTGVVVPPGDQKAFAQAVEVLLWNEPLRRGLGGRARERALSRFTWDSAANEVVRAVEELTKVRQVA